ncbi:putative UDP-Gal:alpha-D-GlcNAc-diphosphoundecaprenol beta-1,4-galactosyltransferase [Vibrio chagasii]|nr:putative UDP-Gal:alpha-D-GlcNAc-diphosphoundecaprenol beta-1,4-galactosyltransferase [Vibrio chagasii]CAH7155754.1 putative UDP-Gal:alpha-D-GlcNAc-diphosphoundecaprenol beta-1,4-galactosyltransferase [Vibrio chagasii]CAH7210389.1 putative UDP-Gal:alpha-D-GlcNAc-diphosphoundecaprenol beta-1,4-galactosyltransferase [Vibrio chagasii]
MACNIFINHFSLYTLYKEGMLEDVLENADNIYCDGMLLVNQLNILLGWEIKRFSFDWSSVAEEVILKYSSQNGILFWGGEKDSESDFLNHLSEDKGLNNIVCLNGFTYSLEDITSHVDNINPSAIVIGRGTPLQEKNAVAISNTNKKIDVYTCGGFISQVSSFGDIYGGIYSWVPRWLSRMIRQPFVIKRILCVYPLSFILVFKLTNLLKKNAHKFKTFGL